MIIYIIIKKVLLFFWSSFYRSLFCSHFFMHSNHNVYYVESSGHCTFDGVYYGIGTLLVASPEVTAKREQYLSKTWKNDGSQQNVYSYRLTFISSLLESAPKQVDNMKEHIEKATEKFFVGSCPSCENGKIQDNGKLYGCPGNREGCNFTENISRKKTI